MIAGLDWRIFLAAVIEILLFVGTLGYGILAFISQQKLSKILRCRRPGTHDRLTTFVGVSGGRNSFRGIQYIQSPEDMDDKEIAAAKTSCRRRLYVFFALLIALFLFPVASIGTALFIKMTQLPPGK